MPEAQIVMVSIPSDHRGLLEQPVVAVLTTLLPDGFPQTQPVWFSFEPPWLLINTMRGFRKERNMRADPRVTVLVIDPKSSSRWIELRGTVELIEDGAQAHLDSLARRYAGVDRYFGGCVPAELAARERPVLGRITVTHVVDETSADRACERTPMAPAMRQRIPDAERIPIPSSHRDLLSRPLVAALSTLRAGCRPQTEPVWFDFDGTDVLVNTTRERQKGRNLERNPRAGILIIDPDDSARWIEIRGVVEISETGAVEHVDRLTRSYTRWPQYYGYVHPRSQRERETRIICRLRPRHVVCDAIHRPLRVAAVGAGGSRP